MIFKLENIGYTIDGNVILKDINLEVSQGEFIIIVGPSGSGKSTLLNIMGGLLRPTNGNLNINSEDIYKFSEKKQKIFRLNNLSIVFQDLNLLSYLNALENVNIYNTILKVPQQQYTEMFEYFNMTGKQNIDINKLSGGERQRVAIMRALSAPGNIILMDEPTGNLDHKNSLLLVEKLLDQNKDKNKTIIMVTHDLGLEKYADKVYQLNENGLNEVNL